MVLELANNNRLPPAYLTTGITKMFNIYQAATNGQNRALPRLDENRNSSPDVRFLGKYFPGNNLLPGK